MLVISRKSQEFLQIGDNIVVKVIKTARGSVKIGIEAPGGTRVLRGELTEEMLEAPIELVSRPRLTTLADIRNRKKLRTAEAV